LRVKLKITVLKNFEELGINKKFIKGLNEDIFTEGFWNYIWINYFNNDDEEIFVKMMTHFRKRYEEKINELVGDKLR